MRRNLLLTVVFFIALFAALAIIIIAGRMYDQNGLLFGGKTAGFTQGWKTADGAFVTVPGTITDTGNNTIKIVNTLPAVLQNDVHLFLKTSYQSVQVIIGGAEVYSWNLANKALFIRPFGLSGYIINIPAASAGKQIELSFLTNQKGDSVTIYSITLGDGITTAVTMIKSNLDSIVLFFVLAVLFLLISSSALLFRKRLTGQSSEVALHLSLFIALSAVWIITDSDVLLLLTTNVTRTVYISLFSQMLLPLPLLLFMRSFSKKGKLILNVLAALVLLNFSVCLWLLLSGTADLIQTLFSTHILELLTCIAIIILCIVEYIKFKHKDMLDVFIGFCLLCLFSIASVLIFSLTGNPGSSLFVHIGLTAFILTLGVVVIRRSVNELARSKSYEKLTLSIPSGICKIENLETGRIIFANEFYYRMFGYTEEEARQVGFTSSHFTVLPEDLAVMKAHYKKYSTVSVHWIESEARHVKKDGEIIWILARYKSDRNNSGEITLVMIDITDRKQMEEKLRISEEEYRIATSHSNKRIVRFDIRTKTGYGQQDVDPVFGLPPCVESIPESIIAAGLIAPDSVFALREFYNAIFRGERDGSVVVSMLEKASGEFRWFHFDFTSIFDDNNKPVQAIISFYDVTLLRQKELAFQRWQQSYNALPKNATNYYEYNLTSDLFEHAEGAMIPTIPDMIPRKLADVTTYIAKHHIYRDDIQIWLEFMGRTRLLDRYASGLHTDKIEFRRLMNDTPMWTSLNLQLIPDPYSSDVKGYFLLEDIDEQKRAEIYLQERSTRDSLTGLLNRITFIEKFEDILSKSDPDTQHALIMLDIDNFKTINDTLGHNAGDALLVNIAGKLRYALRAADLCGRLGGDEFVICLRNMNNSKTLETRVNDLANLICDEHTWGVTVSASFGISGFPYDGRTFDELYLKADTALYKAKSQGRGGFAVYDPQLSFDDLSVPVRRS